MLLSFTEPAITLSMAQQGRNVCCPLLMWFNLHPRAIDCRHRLFPINRQELYGLQYCIAILSIPPEFHKRLRRRESFSSQKEAIQLHLISNFGWRFQGGLMSFMSTSNDEHCHDYCNQPQSFQNCHIVTEIAVDSKHALITPARYTVQDFSIFQEILDFFFIWAHK